MLKGRAWVWILMAASIITPIKLAAQTDAAGITELPPVSGEGISWGFSVNSLGVAVGVSGQATTSYATMWGPNGSVTNLGFEPGYTAYSINDSGQVLVDATEDALGDGPRNASVWQAGTITTLSNFFVVSAEGYGPNPYINNLGQVAGYIVQSGTNVVAIYNTANGTVTQLGEPPGSNPNVYGTEVNTNGHVIANGFASGYQTAYFYNGTPWTIITPPPGFNYVNAMALNDSDEVVGAANNGSWHAYSWTPSSGMSFLQTVGNDTFAIGINNSGVIVGEDAGAGFPFMYISGTEVDLNAFLAKIPSGSTPFQQFNLPYGINDNDQIVGFGILMNEEGVGFVLPPLGSSQFYPYLPTSGSGQEYFFEIVPLGNGQFEYGWFPRLWLDPPLAYGYHYAIESNGLFTEIANFPAGFTNSFTVSVNGTVLGQFVTGQSVVFSNYVAQLGSSLSNNTGVAQFDVSGIVPPVDAQNPLGFPLEIGFSSTNPVINMTMTAIIPQLTIIPSGANIIVSWPSLISGWTLQTNNNLATGTWGNYTGPVVNNTVTNPFSTGNMFFRLLLP
jgi:hypothetical protein